MKVAVVMGSNSDFPIMKEAINILKEFNVEVITQVVSAHRTPHLMYEFAQNIEANNIKIIIAGAGGAAHLPGMLASLTNIPVIGVPIKLKALSGLDSLLSIVQMPSGIPVACMGINQAKNGGLMALKILALSNQDIQSQLKEFTLKQEKMVLEMELAYE